MTPLSIALMTQDDLDEAAVLLAARHARHVVDEPLLDPSYADPSHARRALVWQDETSGAVARCGGEMVGYLFGTPKPGDAWGPNLWVESAGVAVREAELARDLYAVAAATWVRQGRTAHYVLVPAYDTALIDAWFRVGFGLQHEHGVREPARAPEPPPGVRLRRAVRTDLPVLAELDLVLPAHQGASPVFSARHMPTLEEALAEYAADFDDPTFTTFVAEMNGVVLGSAIACALLESSLHLGPARADDAAFLGYAAVMPDARGRGIGRALGEAVIGWAADNGYRSVVTDWRTTNLLSSRTWPRLGFRSTFARLHRQVGY